MTITEDRLSETHFHTRTLRLVHMDALPTAGWSYKGKQYVPEWAVAQWKHGEPIKSIKVSGSVLKKDGTPGENSTSIEYTTPDHKGWRLDGEAPQWLLDLFADSPYTTPEGA